MPPKTYYEILGIAPHVGSGQIQAAYRFARSLYTGEATPTYGLLDAEERAQMLVLVEEAYGALSNPNVRRDYDLQLAASGVATPSAVASDPVRAKPPRRKEQAPPSSPVPPAAVGTPPEKNDPPLAIPEELKGGSLRALRERRGLSIDQIAALSKVGSRFLKALEEDRHDQLPGRVFARGFLIEYARAIRVSEQELVDRYLRHWTGK